MTLTHQRTGSPARAATYLIKQRKQTADCWQLLFSDRFTGARNPTRLHTTIQSRRIRCAPTSRVSSSLAALRAAGERLEKFDCLLYVGSAARLIGLLALNAENAAVTNLFEFVDKTVQADTSFA
jgi:hypothetical protein